MMLDSRYNIQWVGRCLYENSDKIWGWFLYIDPTEAVSRGNHAHAYVFWGATGKTLSFKKHIYLRWSVDKLVQKKIDRKYSPITIKELCSLWNGEEPLYETINNKFVFHLLANDI